MEWQFFYCPRPYASLEYPRGNFHWLSLRHCGDFKLSAEDYKKPLIDENPTGCLRCWTFSQHLMGKALIKQKIDKRKIVERKFLWILISHSMPTVAVFHSHLIPTEMRIKINFLWMEARSTMSRFKVMNSQTQFRNAFMHNAHHLISTEVRPLQRFLYIKYLNKL